MEPTTSSYWQAIGVENWKYAPTPLEAIRAYLQVVPVAYKSFLPTLLNREIPPSTIGLLRERGIAIADRRIGDFEKRKLLWSRSYIKKAKGEWTRLATDQEQTYMRKGWNPILGPMALRGVGLLAEMQERPSILLLGADLVRWACTFTHPGVPLPEPWCTEHLGTGAGMLLIPSNTPKQPEEWFFFIEPRCFIERSLLSLITDIKPMLEARVLSGTRVKVTFLLGYNSEISPGQPHSTIRWTKCHKLALSELNNILDLGQSGWISLGISMVACMRERPFLWRYYECRNLMKRKWTCGVYPFSSTLSGEIRVSRRKPRG